MQVDQIEIEALAFKCLDRMQDLHPAHWKTIIQENYRPILEAKMVEMATGDPYEAAVFLYNHAVKVNDKVWWLATAKALLIEAKIAAEV